MNKRTTFMLTGMALLGLAVAALPQAGFAQTDMQAGTWQSTLRNQNTVPDRRRRAKPSTSKGRAKIASPRFVGINAAGNPTVVVFTENVQDGKPHPVTGSPDFDASVATRVDVYTVNFSRIKAGKVVQTGTNVVSRDGKTWTFTGTGTDANGRQINNIVVYDKQ